jgi:ubiquinone biosynthesis protein
VAAHVRVPAIHWPFTRRRVLTMEFIDGTKINDVDALAARGVDIEEVVAWATRAFLHMIFRDGFFHCDPHPGNLLVDPEGRIGILDFGMNERLEPAVMQMMRENLLSSVQRDPDRYARSLLDADMIDARDFDTVVELARIMLDPQYYNLTPSEMVNIDFGEYFRKTRVHLKKVRSFRLPDGIVMWSRALTLLMGLATELAPGIRPLEVVGPYVMQFLAGPEGDFGAASTPDENAPAPRSEAAGADSI